MTDIVVLQAFYQRYLKDHPGGGGWPSVDEAEQVYKNATSSAIIPWKKVSTVLDVGSGTGGLLPYLRREKAFRGYYTGIEALDALLMAPSKEVLSDENARFLQGDFLNAEKDFDLRADWLFAIGTLGTDQPRKAEYDLAVILKMAELANLGFTIDLIDVRLFSPERLREVPGLFAHDVGLLLMPILSRVSYAEVHVVHDHCGNCALNCLLKHQ